jgi:hypothetical protein
MKFDQRLLQSVFRFGWIAAIVAIVLAVKAKLHCAINRFKTAALSRLRA